MVMQAPGNIAELSPSALDAWTLKLAQDFAAEIEQTRDVPNPAQDRAWFFNAAAGGLANAQPLDIGWTAYPKKASPSQHALVDDKRDLQEEYCEWEVARANGRVVRITFTTETPDYYAFLWDHDKPKLLELYRKHVSPAVRLQDLVDALGGYNPRNAWNWPMQNRGALMHMGQPNNTLRAAMNLSAQATWPVVDAQGAPVTSEQGLIRALRFGDPARHSDPHIGAQINGLVRAGREVSFADPVGLYIDEIDLAGFELPGNAPAEQLMRVTRGEAGFMLRVVFEAPAGANFVLGDVKIDGRALRFGSQVAERIKVRVRGAARLADAAVPQLQLPGLTVVGAPAPQVAAAAAAGSPARSPIREVALGATRAGSFDSILSPELAVAPMAAAAAPAQPTVASQLRPMRIQVRAGSLAEQRHYLRATEASNKRGDAWASPAALAPGIAPAPAADLVFRGGKVVPKMEFQNVYLGGKASWLESDVTSIDRAIDLAMRERRLNNVMKQYFEGTSLDCSMRASFVHAGAKPPAMDESDVQAMVVSLFDTGAVKKSDLDTCIFNLVLPRGTVLSLDDVSSLDGLGGFHGSTHLVRNGRRITLYYSANVYSTDMGNFRQNGIVAFPQPWQNVVGTLYHELNEFRTDPDVNDAIVNNDNGFCGWTSNAGQEVGDQPIFKAGANLSLVFQEVQNADLISLPVQFMYSNKVHGAEGPID